MWSPDIHKRIALAYCALVTPVTPLDAETPVAQKTDPQSQDVIADARLNLSDEEIRDFEVLIRVRRRKRSRSGHDARGYRRVEQPLVISRRLRLEETETCISAYTTGSWWYKKELFPPALDWRHTRYARGSQMVIHPGSEAWLLANRLHPDKNKAYSTGQGLWHFYGHTLWPQTSTLVGRPL
jgi:hypothetical protein